MFVKLIVFYIPVSLVNLIIFVSYRILFILFYLKFLTVAALWQKYLTFCEFWIYPLSLLYDVMVNSIYQLSIPWRASISKFTLIKCFILIKHDAISICFTLFNKAIINTQIFVINQSFLFIFPTINDYWFRGTTLCRLNFKLIY